MLRQGGYLMIDDVNLYAEKEMARLLSEHAAFSLALDLGKSLVFRKLTADRHLGEWCDQPYIVRRTREYARFPHSYSLRDPPALYLTKIPYWMKRLLHRIRNIIVIPGERIRRRRHPVLVPRRTSR